jgi:hypothetical protein
MDAFERLAPGSKIWIYQSKEALTPETVAGMQQYTTRFLSQWTSHGSPVTASFQILYNHFLIVGVDEEMISAGGCSIDKLLQFVQSLEKEFKISLLDRQYVAWMDQRVVKTTPMNDFEAMIEAGAINENTIVFNNMVVTKAGFQSEWMVPLHSSWHSRMLKVK